MNNSDLKNENVAETEINKATTEASEVKETKNENDSTTTKEEDVKKDEASETTEVKEESTIQEENKEEVEDTLKLNFLDKQFVYDVLSVPTYSRAEYRMVTFIMMWARTNNIHYEFDDYGNIYLTKGELDEGEFYPCVTSHLDTVQTKQEAYAQCGVGLPLLERINTKGQHELYVKDTGIGADDKAGVLISLSLFKYFDKLKACFFLEEEVGCCGSKKLNKNWFTDVAYVIGWDSPDRNRAAFACSSELLMSKKLFETIEETCKENGVTDFRSEPFTDVKEIRLQTGIECMNFGNGGYNAHAVTEYVVIEDIDGACGLGVALIKKLGNKTQYEMKSKTYSYYASSSSNADEDIAFFAKKFSTSNTAYYRNSSYPSTNKTTYTPTTSTTTTTKNNEVANKMLEHVVDRYEKYIEDIQKKVEDREAIILNSIKQLCEKNGVDYNDYLDIFIDNPSTDPFSTAIEF